MSNETKDLIHDFYDDKELSNAQVKELQSLFKEQNQVEIANTSIKDKFTPKFVMSLVASFLLVALLNFRYFTYKSVEMEVAYNHNKNVPAEITTGDVLKIRNHLTKLDFPVIASAKIDPNRFELVGARYCSIQGKLAAQLKYKDLQTGRTSTVYQVPNDNYSEIDKHVSGVRVKGWVEKDLFIVQAIED